MEKNAEVDRGAEAVVEMTEYLGYKAILKHRPKKTYRHPELDSRLRTSRTKNEAKLIRDVRTSGVKTPIIFDIDLHNGNLIMEYIEGKKVKDVIDSGSDAENVCMKIGESLAKMHNANICHGDLTTSNMILTDDGELCIIDFSMGSSKCGLEEKGVDLHLLERAFSSAHSESFSLFDTIIESYRRHMPESDSVLKRVQNIKERARYT